MRTNVVLDDKLIEEAKKITGIQTKKDVITYALKELVISKKRRNLIDIAGKIKFDDEYDYKRLRENR